MILDKDISYLLEEVRQNYQLIHRHPELGYQEEKTASLVMERLESYGIKARQIALTGVVATIEGSVPGKTIALRADIDALPFSEETNLPYASEVSGVMHACGHDAHTAILLAVARYFAEHREQLQGSVRLIFQPAEEGWEEEDTQRIIAAGGSELGGAASMIACGALEGVDHCFALHVDPLRKVGQAAYADGPMFAASDRYDLTIIGKGGHGAEPEDAIDPTAAAAEIILAYQLLAGREFGAGSPAVISVGSIHTDSTWNNIPGWVKIAGTTRTYDEELRLYMLSRLKEVAENISAAHRCRAVFRRIQGDDACINAEEAIRVGRCAADKIFGADNVFVIPPMMGAEDVGRYFHIVPGMMMYLGTGHEDEESMPLHNPRFVMNQDAFSYGIRLFIQYVQEFLGENRI